MIVPRTWHETGSATTNDQLVSIHEVRGNGRRRHMLRPWGFEPDAQSGWNTWADNASALWTVYDGDEPTSDYRMIDHPTLGTLPYPEKSYTLGVAQRTPDGEVKYFHTDHLGTTQAMTDADQAVNPRIVYTAFGEVIDAEGDVDTRYQYVGKDGYEMFDVLPFVHVGHRWYDATCARFLQRDPTGLRGGVNVYGYVQNRAANATDPDGLRLDWETHEDGPPPFVGPVLPQPPRPTVRQLLAYDVSRAYLFVTGGRQSWLDDPIKVKKAQKVLYMTSLVCASAASGLPVAAKVVISITGGTINVIW